MTEEERESFERIMYALEKGVCRQDFMEWLDDWEIEESQYVAFKKELVEKLGLDGSQFYRKVAQSESR